MSGGLGTLVSGGLQLASNITSAAGAPAAVSQGLSGGASLAKQVFAQMGRGGVQG